MSEVCSNFTATCVNMLTKSVVMQRSFASKRAQIVNKLSRWATRLKAMNILEFSRGISTAKLNFIPACVRLSWRNLNA